MSNRTTGERQKLVLCFDGTWNDGDDHTNVYRMARSVADFDAQGIRQRFFYDPGVGTGDDRLSGGALGSGLTANLLEGYEWLAQRYAEGDQVFVFGFSRGAFTARSLVGMIRKCGLLHVTTPKLLANALELYKDIDQHPDGDACKTFRQDYSRTIRVDFIGVWDTVGSLGIPGTTFNENGKYKWHDTELSKVVDRAYQAMALDEHRAPYDVVFWTSETGQKKPENLDVEQRWFIGAHADVGGGYKYKEQKLADIALRWLQDKAVAAGLKLTPLTEPKPDAYTTTPTDSYKKFLAGFYRLYREATFRRRYHRPFSRDSKGKLAVNVTVDASVWQKWHAEASYRPKTLAGVLPPPPPTAPPVPVAVAPAATPVLPVAVGGGRRTGNG